MKEILTLEEITQVCTQAAELGIRKIKVTGGEPLVRRGCPELITMLKNIPGVEQVTLTTNGVLLAQYAQQLQDSGLDGVNVSLDTLNRETYRAITDADGLADTLSGITAAERLGIPLKINAVLQAGVNDGEWAALTELARNHKLDVRFIEMMPIGHGREFSPISNQELLQAIRQRYGDLQRDSRSHGNGPAIYYQIPHFMGSVGFISAVHGKFCNQCNRIRMTATGYLKGCLCYEEGVSLREPLRQGNLDRVRQLLCQVIETKPVGHCFEKREQITERHDMSKIGG
jgi:cyclic pyranopterin phosphate synthase